MSRSARSLDSIQLPPWRVLAFTDLHVSAKTMERSLEVLRRVRKTAVDRCVRRIVFCGDFWDARGVLAVRQVDALLSEFYAWHEAGLEVVIIPGNHDQVSMDGLIHGVRIFEPFPRFHVATDRILWPERKLAFLPWREDPAEQSALFDLPGTDWTIFAHAEVAGARTNYGYTAPGRVSLADIERVARACYCGHYHASQKLGDRTYYLGNPYQKDFGEIDDPPKGIALITEDTLEPEWLPLEGFPRHHRVYYGTPFEVTAISGVDIVELYAPPEKLGTEELAHFRTQIPARDVRPLPLPADGEEDEGAPPAFALRIDEAIDEYVDAYAREAEREGRDIVEGDVGADDLKGFARAVLSELPEARAINPVSPHVDIIDVEATDFCAIRGTVRLDLDNRGLLLISGRMGIGKTALTDALNWCLYGTTSPRKAGSAGSTFRGDEVINDDAKRCEVVVRVRLGDGREVAVRREKQRGKGAAASVDGIEDPDGIKDSQDIIERVVGLPYALWRACVSLGQGAVSNFATDADKARKGLLASAFGLDVCPDALKVVRDRAKPLRVKLDAAQREATTIEARIETLRGTDYTEQIEAFEAQREAAKRGAHDAGNEARATIEECESQLATEPEWENRKREHEAHAEALVEQLATITASGEVVMLERELGGLQAEQSRLVADESKARASLEELKKSAAAGPMPCPTCGQPMQRGDVQVLVGERETEIERYARALKTNKQKITNLQVKIDSLGSGAKSDRERIEAELAKSRAALEKIGTALRSFARLRANLESAQQRLEKAREVWAENDKAENPWRAKQEEVEGQIAEFERQRAEYQDEAEQLRIQISVLEFWETGFSQKGLPVLVLRTALHELESHANRFLAALHGRVFVQLAMLGDDLQIRYFEQEEGVVRERRYEQLSAGQRRCVELSFSPFALSEMIFARCGVRVPLLIIDELTSHLGAEEKPQVCEVLRSLGRNTVLVIDHDVAVQAEFDVAYALERGVDSMSRLERVKR